jgi:hypothetical protein
MVESDRRPVSKAIDFVPLLAALAVEQDGDGTLIAKRNLHVRPKFSRWNLPACFPSQTGKQLLVYWEGVFWTGGRAIGGAVAFAGAGQESELANDKHLSSSLQERAIHYPGFIGKNPQPGDFAHNPLNVLSSVAFFNSNENQKTTTDLPHNLPADRHGRFRNPLHDHSHGHTDSRLSGLDEIKTNEGLIQMLSLGRKKIAFPP